MPTCYITVGLPYSGKTTLIKNDRILCGIRRLSSDDIIDQMCKDSGITYNEGFSQFVEAAQSQFMDQVEDCIIKQESVILDRTSLTKKSRARWISRFTAAGYIIVAIYKKMPDDPKELEFRIRTRPNQVVPMDVIKDMESRLELPCIEEGFDLIRVYD